MALTRLNLMLDFEVLIKLGLKPSGTNTVLEIIGISLFGFAFCKGCQSQPQQHG